MTWSLELHWLEKGIFQLIQSISHQAACAIPHARLSAQPAPHFQLCHMLGDLYLKMLLLIDTKSTLTTCLRGISMAPYCCKLSMNPPLPPNSDRLKKLHCLRDLSPWEQSRGSRIHIALWKTSRLSSGTDKHVFFRFLMYSLIYLAYVSVTFLIEFIGVTLFQCVIATFSPLCSILSIIFLSRKGT